jgi:hypothetical protein
MPKEFPIRTPPTTMSSREDAIMTSGIVKALVPRDSGAIETIFIAPEIATQTPCW